MRKPILSSVLALLLILILVLSGIAIAKWSAAYRELKVEAKSLREERDALRARLQTAEQLAGHLVAKSAAADGATPPQISELGSTPSPGSRTAVRNTLNLWAVRPDISTNAAGRRDYHFGELYGSDNQVIARDAYFEELLGFTKLAFRTSKGTRYYDIDDLHPEVVKSLGYDVTVLKRRLADETRQRQLLGAQAKLQAELRAKTAAEFADREKAAAERLKAEAAIRDAQARERLAEVAERAATNPPKERIVPRYVIVSPYAKVITNPPPTLP